MQGRDLNNNNENLINKFDPSEYFKLIRDPDILDNSLNEYCQPLQKGRELIVKYYKEKYQANITFAMNPDNPEMYADPFSFAKTIKDQLKVARATKGDYRLTFFVGAGAKHAVPFVYLRENGKEGLLYADSMTFNEYVLHLLKKEIPVFTITEGRQSDTISCYSDVVVLGRDATAINPNTKTYYIPNLLTFLENNSKKRDGYFIVDRLPNELLKTAQISSFLLRYQERAKKKKIHKDETLSQFRERYSDRNILIRSPLGMVKSHKKISNYLRMKGFKFARIIVIQFYLEEILGKVGALLTSDVRNFFIKNAKFLFRNDPVHDFSRIHEFAESVTLLLKQGRLDLTVVQQGTIDLVNNNPIKMDVISPIDDVQQLYFSVENYVNSRTDGGVLNFFRNENLTLAKVGLAKAFLFRLKQFEDGESRHEDIVKLTRKYQAFNFILEKTKHFKSAELNQKINFISINDLLRFLITYKKETAGIVSMAEESHVVRDIECFFEELSYSALALINQEVKSSSSFHLRSLNDCFEDFLKANDSSVRLTSNKM